MFVARIDTENGELHGWLQAGAVDLFVWFEASALAQAQITVGLDVAEWSAPSRLNTGKLRDAPADRRRSQSDAGIIDFDRRLQPDRRDSIRTAVAATDLPAEAIRLVDALMMTPAAPSIPELAAKVEALVRAAPRTAEK